MATTKTVLKKTPIHCVVAISGTSASETIALDGDLVTSSQTASSPKVNITAIHWAVPGATGATVTRNSNLLWNLAGSYNLNFNGFSENRDQGSDIVVAMPAGGGTVILELLKVSGYGDAQHRNQTEPVG